VWDSPTEANLSGNAERAAAIRAIEVNQWPTEGSRADCPENSPDVCGSVEARVPGGTRV
jgi:hypothetical protein